MFDKSLNTVALIEKNRPDWQKGRLNGLGGKIEYGESAVEAMIREFEEEGGVYTKDWNEFCNINGKTCQITCFWAIGNILEVRMAEDQEIFLVDTRNLVENKNILPNVAWLIPMAFAFIRNQEHAKGFEINER